MAFQNYFKGKRVVVTGHTGFKGSWLCRWLERLGAQVSGFALDPEPGAVLFEQLGLPDRISHTVGDIRDAAALQRFVLEVEPQVIFHLAAQSLVRRSFDQPVETFATNAQGSVHLLEAVRQLEKPCVVVMVTTDKCYENKEWLHAYRETDPMGGYDPYSASKGCAELVTSSYRRSFFAQGTDVKLASARAGNVLGGGDWAADRIFPDIIRALRSEQPVAVRNPASTRPWQHVLEPLGGYLHLAASMGDASSRLMQAVAANGPDTDTLSFNFGPVLEANRPVKLLVESVLKHWPGTWEDHGDPNAPHEASLLNLAIDKAYHLLSWKPVWDFEACVERTVDWYRQVHEGTSALAMTDKQIDAYEEAGCLSGQFWADEN